MMVDELAYLNIQVFNNPARAQSTAQANSMALEKPGMNANSIFQRNQFFLIAAQNIMER
jgi:hypothetical protein